MELHTQTIPAVVLVRQVIAPGFTVRFEVQLPGYMKAVERAIKKGRMLAVLCADRESQEFHQLADVRPVAAIAEIRQYTRLPDGTMRVLAEGIRRASVTGVRTVNGARCAEICELSEKEDLPGSASEREALMRTIRECFEAYSEEHAGIDAASAARVLEGAVDPAELSDRIAAYLPLRYERQYLYLSTLSKLSRCELLCTVLKEETEIEHLQNTIRRRIHERMDKAQRDYVLQEELKMIREELGEGTAISDVDRFRESLRKLRAVKDVKARISEEIDRFSGMSEQSPESQVLRGYLETVLKLPWNKAGRDRGDLALARQILDRDHYGLEKVKERILEFLAVRQLTGKGAGPILCLVGPPGTGKTSIGRSIAEALDKKYVRLSLGGVRDEAEIRGHRRTYVGAMPGRIASSLIQAGVRNPLMVLDEIDKMSSDYKGDTASALLEVLDSEQNCRFEDHYIEIPLDLSDVMFVATANDTQTIPRPLLDRMEIIEISSYTSNEKMHIGKEHLFPRQKEKNGIEAGQLTITDKAMQAVISQYTREAGVRQFERMLGQICRRSARMIIEEKKKLIRVSERNLKDFLGQPHYLPDKASRKDEIGIVRGLAWSPVGGTTLEVEVNIMPGKGVLKLTGQLGDVMKESAEAGVTYIRSIVEKEGIDPEYFSRHDIHVHIPEGAVPKDGPSAGVTMATAIYSALMERKVRADTAMTGEITLRGRVLPIGGLKEKLLAARTAGCTRVLVPEKNRSDVAELDHEITSGLTVIFTKDMKEVLQEALV